LRVSFNPCDCTVHIKARAFRKEIRIKKDNDGFIKHRNENLIIEYANVSVTIPSCWRFGDIIWSGNMQIDDHTITFSVDNGRNSLIPPIPIRLQN
jgi:hypothetical protein